MRRTRTIGPRTEKAGLVHVRRVQALADADAMALPDADADVAGRKWKTGTGLLIKDPDLQLRDMIKILRA